MSGRHRQGPTTGARRALAGAVPALGLAGVVTAALGSGADGAQETAADALVTTPIPAPGPVAIDQPDLGAGPDVTTVAADASRAAGQADAERREQERRSIVALVADVRDDAQARDAAAGEEGRRQLDAFQRQQREQTAPRPTAPDDTEHPGRSSGSGDPHDGDEESCTLSGLPLMGTATDGDEIVDRDCGLLDMVGGQRSSDPWIDGQLLDARADD